MEICTSPLIPSRFSIISTSFATETVTEEATLKVSFEDALQQVEELVQRPVKVHHNGTDFKIMQNSSRVFTRELEFKQSPLPLN